MRELKAFARVDLDPGAMKTVQLSVPVRDMSYWDSTKNGWAVEQGTYTVYVGPSADETTLKHATFTVN
jgi:beta-glucosidase